MYNNVINSTINNNTCVVVTVVVTVIVVVVNVVAVVVTVVVAVVVVELAADVSLVLYNRSPSSQSSSVSVLVFLFSQITSSAHSTVYHMLQHCNLPSLSLPPGSYISLQQPPTSPPLHSLIHCTVHVHSVTCTGLYSEVGMLLEHGHHYQHDTPHTGRVMWGGGGMRDDVVRHVVLICNSI